MKPTIREYTKPKWKPTLASPTEWTLAHLEPYLRQSHGTVFSFGSAVIWPKDRNLSKQDCKRHLFDIRQDPTFSVGEHSHFKHFMATFYTRAMGVMSTDLLDSNLTEFRRDVFSLGLYPGESLIDKNKVEDPADRLVIAGLYIRARIYMDAENPIVIKVS